MPHKDPEKARAWHAAYYATHREESRARCATYYAAHKEEARARYGARREEIRAYHAVWSAAHREERRAYRAIHCEKRRAQNAAWCAAHPEAKRELNRKHRALKLQIRQVAPERVLTKAQWDKILKLSKGRCYWCKGKRKLTQDHVIPLCKGGLHVAENVVTACDPCNKRKGMKCITLF